MLQSLVSVCLALQLFMKAVDGLLLSRVHADLGSLLSNELQCLRGTKVMLLQDGGNSIHA